MRISDWSSDVCSSDLPAAARPKRDSRLGHARLMALVELLRTDRNEALIIVGRLETADIPAIAFDADASIAGGSWMLVPSRVLVDEDDLRAARPLPADPPPVACFLIGSAPVRAKECKS